MTDRECLAQLIVSLGLTPTKDDDQPGFREFSVIPPDDDGRVRVQIGAGDGYSGFYAEFCFDADGNVQAHKVVE